MKRHTGSTIAIICGASYFVSGFTQPGPGLTVGPVIILGALAYRSAKKRKLGEKENTGIRIGLELLAITVAACRILFLNDLPRLIEDDPAPHLLIPIWVLIAYIIIFFWKSPSQNKRPVESVRESDK